MSTGARLGDAVVAIFMLAQVGCASVLCPPQQASPLISIDHIGPGDGPTGTTRSVYSDGTIEWVGVRRYSKCQRLDSIELESLKTVIEEHELVNEPSYEGFISHQEIIQVHREGATRVYLFDRPPLGILPVLTYLDVVFEKRFGRRYTRMTAPP